MAPLSGVHGTFIIDGGQATTALLIHVFLIWEFLLDPVVPPFGLWAVPPCGLDSRCNRMFGLITSSTRRKFVSCDRHHRHVGENIRYMTWEGLSAKRPYES